MKLILTVSVIVLENIKPSVFIHRPLNLGLYILLRSRALYFPVKYKAGYHARNIALENMALGSNSIGAI